MVAARPRTNVDQLAVEFEQPHVCATAQLLCTPNNEIESRLWITWRVRHRLQNVDSGGLMLDALAILAVAQRQRRGALFQRAKRLCAGDGDDCLVCERLQK